MGKPILNALANILGERHLISGKSMAERTNGYWDSSPLRALALAIPESISQVQAVMACCHQHRQPVVIQGGLTGTVCGQLAAPHELAISLERLTAITDFDSTGKTLVVEAGCTLQAVQEFAREHQLLFPVDIGSRGSCTIGGNIATNAGGMEVLRYGMMRHQVLGIEAVLADGTLLSSMNRMKKNNAGYDVKQLMIGSEGTLGIVTRAVLQLQPLPLSRETAILGCPSFGELEQVLDGAQRNLGDTLTRFEVMDGSYYKAQTLPGRHRPPLSGDHAWYALVEIMGFHPDKDRALFEQWLESLLGAGTTSDIAVAMNDRQREELWGIRENFDITIAEKPFFLYDLSLPIPAMSKYLADLQEIVSREWPSSILYALGHMADGNLHLFLAPRSIGEEKAQKDRSDMLVFQALAPYGGSVSAEHGIGLDKKRWLSQSRNPQEIAVMKTIKAALDPLNILNPARVFDL